LVKASFYVFLGRGELIGYIASLKLDAIKDYVKNDVDLVKTYDGFLQAFVKREELEELKKKKVGEIIDAIAGINKEVGEYLKKDGKKWLEKNLESLKKL
jgi:hypothetical protein